MAVRRTVNYVTRSTVFGRAERACGQGKNGADGAADSAVGDSGGMGQVE